MASLFAQSGTVLKIYNILVRDQQDFSPIKLGRVRMHVCGMTVYDYCHLGQARVKDSWVKGKND
jgi:cysteinyl-tRNA synthetase